MALFKCKMCGGDLTVTEGMKIVECDFCGTTQTVPNADDEKKTNLFNRANRLRIASEFDRAAGIYESIIAEFPNEAEAYWGLCLCKYGIEYVDDPRTANKIPTCHRTSFESIFNDNNYKQALSHSDLLAKSIYENEAKAIDLLQKDILNIVQNEKPFDVFICYKETDETGNRTQDSVLAQDIYDHLTDKGFKVFFARITLEDKLGQQYEPYIFAALNSAKVMLAIGTKPEYFSAVWVKNEWSRFLDLMRSDKNKTLVPCYLGMDPYDMPDEFKNLQAQDLGKLGYIQDLTRGIAKIVKVDEAKPTMATENIGTNANANVVPLLKRALMCLEDGEFERADEFCEQVLNIDPENAQAYLGKLMAELQVRKQEALKDCAKLFDSNSNYQKTIRFADEKLKAELTGYVEHIKTRNENARLQEIYNKAKNAMDSANTEDAYEEAIEMFKSISGWKDADEQIVACKRKKEEFKAKEEADRLERERKAEIARKEAEKRAKRNKKIAIIAAPLVCAIIAFIIVLNDVVIIPNSKYNDAIALMRAGNIVEAYEALVALDGYKDSADKADSIYDRYKVEKLKVAKAGDYVFFGAYEQDNNTSNGKEEIEWLVLEVKGGKALVISRFALDCLPYHPSYNNVSWETCSLRHWLNNSFIDAAFSADQKAMIPTVTVSADKNPNYNTNPGNATQDQVFLLSLDEANRYFSSKSERNCNPTVYATAKGARVDSSYGNCWWWLRTPGYDQSIAVYVYCDGDVHESGIAVSGDDIAVRPALWIDLSK